MLSVHSTENAFVASTQSLFRACSVSSTHVLKLLMDNLHKMFVDRGYDELEGPTVPYEVFNEMRTVRPVLRARALNGGRASAYVLVEDKIAVKTLRSIMDGCDDEVVVLVAPDGPTHFTRKESEAQYGERVHYFTFREMCINPAHHRLTPKHEIVHEWKGIPTAFLPKIQKEDAIVRYYDFPVGSVVRITRTHGNTEPYYFYRVVVTSE